MSSPPTPRRRLARILLAGVVALTALLLGISLQIPVVYETLFYRPSPHALDSEWGLGAVRLEKRVSWIPGPAILDRVSDAGGHPVIESTDGVSWVQTGQILVITAGGDNEDGAIELLIDDAGLAHVEKSEVEESEVAGSQ